METQFKTTIKCSGCVAAVTPNMNEAVGKENWSVDYNNPLRVLTVKGEQDPQKVIEALAKAGYQAEKLDDLKK